MEFKAILGAILTLGGVASTVLRGLGKTQTADGVDACVQAIPDAITAIGQVLGGFLLFKSTPPKK